LHPDIRLAVENLGRRRQRAGIRIETVLQVEDHGGAAANVLEAAQTFDAPFWLLA
jgi:hypothetical protein